MGYTSFLKERTLEIKLKSLHNLQLVLFTELEIWSFENALSPFLEHLAFTLTGFGDIILHGLRQKLEFFLQNKQKLYKTGSYKMLGKYF